MAGTDTSRGIKVRYYGLFRVDMRRSLARLRSQLRLLQHIADQAPPAPATSDGSTRVVICPSCGQPMRLERVVLPHNRGPPGWIDQHRWRMLGMCRRLVAWLPIRMPASAYPGAVLTTTRTCNSGRAHRSPALMRALPHSVSMHELRVCGHVRLQTTAEQRLSRHVPAPTPT